MPRCVATAGRCRSKSTRHTRVLGSCDSAIARLIVVSVLPSPAFVLVTASERQFLAARRCNSRVRRILYARSAERSVTCGSTQLRSSTAGSSTRFGNCSGGGAGPIGCAGVVRRAALSSAARCSRDRDSAFSMTLIGGGSKVRSRHRKTDQKINGRHGYHHGRCPRGQLPPAAHGEFRVAYDGYDCDRRYVEQCEDVVTAPHGGVECDGAEHDHERQKRRSDDSDECNAEPRWLGRARGYLR